MMLCTLAYGQTEKGRIFLGGSVGIQSNTYNPSNSNTFKFTETNFSVTPQIGYFLTKKWALQASINYSSTWGRRFDPNLTLEQQKYRINSYGFGVGGRYYIPTSHEKFAFFLFTGANVGWGNNKRLSEKSLWFNVNISPNFNYFFTSKWALELSFSGIGFNTATSTSELGKNSQNSFRLGASSFAPYLGVLYFLK